MREGGTTTGRVRLLGPVHLLGADGPLPTRSAFLRTLLALVASRAGSVVPTDALIDELWGEALPQDPKGALQIQVTRLRTWLGGAGLDRSSLRHDHHGYVLELPPAEVDLLRFAAAAEAVAASTDPTATLAACDVALAEWAGPPFGGCVMGLRLEGEDVRHREVHLWLVEQRAEALLAVGRPEDALRDLAPSRAEHPARERLTELAMLALYRTGRQQEALTAYSATRRHLVDEHGLEPSESLVRMEAMVLVHDPALRLDGEQLALGPRPSTADPLAGTRPLIVGRDVQLQAVLAGLADRDHGSLVVVTGEAGAGKSTLVAAAAHDAREAGAAVAVGVCDDDSPLAGWHEALGELGVGTEVLAEGPSRARAVRAALAGHAGSHGALVALEDLHQADLTTLGILRGLARLELPPGVVVVATARNPDVVPHDEWAATAADVARSASAVMVALGGLDRRETEDVVRARLDRLPDHAVARVAQQLWRRTGGHPLHLSALLDGMTGLDDEEACLAAATDVPEHLRPLLDHQLRMLPDECRDLLEVLAVAGPLTSDELAALSGRATLDVLSSLRSARERGLARIRGPLVEIRHALTAQAVIDSMDGATRQALHHRRFQALATSASDPFDRLRHAEGAGHRLDPAALAAARARAGRAAYVRGAHDDAARLLEQALPHVDAADAVDVRLHLGLALGALGRTAASDDLLDHVVDDPAATVEQVVAAAVGHELLGLQVTGDARRLARLRRAHAASREAAPSLRVQVLRALSIEESLDDGGYVTDGARAELDEVLAHRSEEVDPALLAWVRTTEAREMVETPIPAKERLAETEAAYEMAQATASRHLALDALELLVSATIAAGRSDQVDDLRWALRREAERAHRPRSQWASELVDAATAMAEGRGADADAASERALALGLDMGIPDAMGAYGVHQAARHMLEGRLDELSDLIDGAIATYPAIAAWPALAAVARAQAGDVDPALEHLERFAALRARHESSFFDRPALCLAAVASWIIGDHAVTRAVAGTVRRDLPVDGDAVIVVGVGAAILGPADTYSALVRDLLGEEVHARELAEGAARHATALGWPPWQEVADHVVGLVSGRSSPDRTPPPPPGPTTMPPPLGLRRIR